MVKTPPFHGGNMGSIPIRVTNTFPIGISNEWEGTANISCGNGILLVINAKK